MQSIPSLIRFKNNEESQLPKQGMPTGEKSRFRKHYPPRILQNQVGATWRRYRCGTCGKTFCSNSGTPYYRPQQRRAIFDEVAALNVEGLNKSTIARVKRIAWNTVDRWLEKAAASCRRFNDRKITGITVAGL